MNIDNNKLIAEFMELKYKRGAYYDEYNKEKVKQDSNLKFHSSWDWLMPVVEKIENINEWVRVEITNNSIIITYMGYNKITHGKTKIKTVYKAVVEFIKWYNKKEDK